MNRYEQLLKSVKNLKFAKAKSLDNWFDEPEIPNEYPLRRGPEVPYIQPNEYPLRRGPEVPYIQPNEFPLRRGPEVPFKDPNEFPNYPRRVYPEKPFKKPIFPGDPIKEPIRPGDPTEYPFRPGDPIKEPIRPGDPEVPEIIPRFPYRWYEDPERPEIICEDKNVLSNKPYKYQPERTTQSENDGFER